MIFVCPYDGIPNIDSDIVGRKGEALNIDGGGGNGCCRYIYHHAMMMFMQVDIICVCVTLGVNRDAERENNGSNTKAY